MATKKEKQEKQVEDRKVDEKQGKQVELISDPESRSKSQQVKIYVSVFRVGERIVSALGIPSPSALVTHQIEKSKLKPDEIYNIVHILTNDPYYNKDQRWGSVVKISLDDNYEKIEFPTQRANEFSRKSIGKLFHEILNIEIELFSKNS